ncbi:ATP-dependent sacrificial sulfur transferase LarE [Nocardia sp. CA-290969]|uniref:ATP-dependent sacrificial sulfur transferase LarE n=1 Tax=Nocardia sp. CA-290969 TaxID=3239986 RepID=UPI003D91A72C
MSQRRIAAPIRLSGALARAERRVAARLRHRGRLGVAISGGVDSGVLLALAVRELGPDQVVAILGVSPSLARSERRSAHELAAILGVRLVELTTDEGDVPAYRDNGPDRCYHCKHALFQGITTTVLDQEGLEAVAYGENADDIRRPDRPGARAATEFDVLRPLAEAGVDKFTVRKLALALELPCADKPAAPCLASRIPHFAEVTPDKLAQVERAEEAMRSLGFRDLRVRHHGDIARIELSDDEFGKAAVEPARTRIRAAIRAAGFRFVTLDLGGIQSGAFTLPLVDIR